MSQIIDCSQRIEANWNWDTTTFISQAYKNNDQFQEFGLKWYGSGFTYITTPKWINSKYKNGDGLGKTKSHGKHHVRHTVPGSIADRGPDGTGNTATRRQSAAIGSLVFIIVAGLAVLCAVGSLFTAP